MFSNYRDNPVVEDMSLNMLIVHTFWRKGEKPLSHNAHRSKVHCILRPILARGTKRRTCGRLIFVNVFFLTFRNCPIGINMLGPRCEYITIALLFVSVTASSVSENCL